MRDGDDYGTIVRDLNNDVVDTRVFFEHEMCLDNFITLKSEFFFINIQKSLYFSLNSLKIKNAQAEDKRILN